MKKILSLSSEIEAFMILPTMAYSKINMVGECLRQMNPMRHESWNSLS